MQRSIGYQDILDVVEYQGKVVYSGITLVTDNGSYGPLIQFDGTDYSIVGNENLLETRRMSSGNSMAVVGNKLYLAGQVSYSQDVQGTALFEWDGVVWREIAQNIPNTNSAITQLESNGTELFIFGFNMVLNGLPCGPAAKYDGESITRLGTNLDYANTLGLSRYEVPMVNGSPLVCGTLSGSEQSQLLTFQNGEWAPATLPSLTGGASRVMNFRDTLVITGDLNGTNEDTDWSVADLREGRWQPWGTGIDGPINSIMVTDAGILACGEVRYVGLERSAGVVRRVSDRWVDDSAGLDFSQGVRQAPSTLLRRSNGDILIAGRLVFEGGVSAVLGIRRNGRWEPLGTSPANNIARSVVEHNGDVYAAGLLTCADGVLRPLRRWDGMAWQDVADAPLGLGLCLLSSTEGLYIGGFQLSHVTAGNGTVMRLAGQVWENMGTPESSVTALSKSGSELLAGGMLGAYVRGESGWSTKGNGLSGGVNQFIQYRGDLCAIGSFSIEGVDQKGFARLDGNGVWRSTAGGLSRGTRLPIAACSLEVGLSLYIAGRFDGVGSTNAPSYGLARLDCTCPSDWDLDGDVDFFDYLDFVDHYAGGGADFNRDDVTDWFDYLDFVQAFASGC